MRLVSLREANQNFSSCVAEVEAGERLVLTRRGRPVAQIVPLSGEQTMDPRREEALRNLKALLEKGFDLGGVKLDREELYDRGR